MHHAGVSRILIAFNAKQKIRRNQHCLQSHPHTLLEGVTFRLRHRYEPFQTAKFLLRDWASVSSTSQIPDHLSSAFRVVVARLVSTGNDSTVAFGQRWCVLI